MNAPRATMRLQLNSRFTFSAAAALVPYFSSLGISHLYASPIMTARPGSPHGYDVIDPTRVSAELGGEEGLRQLVGKLRRHAMGLIVDIVPNHMAVGSNNAWWTDVLARGQASRYAKYFDIDWTPPSRALRGKVLLPILGKPYGEALDAGEITLGGESGAPRVVRYFDHVLPLAFGSEDEPLDHLDPKLPGGKERLHRLLEAQHYRLAWWRSANDEINWRRFFDINELAALRVEDEEVFEAVHAALFRLYAEGLVDGVRVDHIDGLSQPEAYCRKLRERLRWLARERPGDSPREEAYLVVEKILAHGEQLPESWETDGTTGYDFMDEVGALLHDPDGEPVLRELWQRVSGRSGDFADEEELARREILQRSFSAQQEALIESLHAVALDHLATRDVSRSAIGRCLTEILAHFPVYRIYARIDHCSSADRLVLARAIGRARQTCLATDRWLMDKLADWLCGKTMGAGTEALQAIALARFQQLSAPLCAKAVEDTAFYRYGRLISRNDVGFDARHFASSPREFHQRMRARAGDFPHSMLATATHDHKRGEDVRARLAVLSELAQEWADAVEHWLALSEPYCVEAGPARMPSAGGRAILFQTIVGAWPMELTSADRAGLERYGKRLAAWQQKALREAKLHSDWSDPNEPYERAAGDLIASIFVGGILLPELEAFVRRIAAAGAANSLAQLLTKLTAPGMPDVYRGTEFWDLSLVDPDNRSTVDFAVRQRSLAAPWTLELVSHWADGRIKQRILARVLALRKKAPRLFSDGAYLPLEATGPLADDVVAFARVLDGDVAITIFCRRPHRILAGGALTIAPEHLKTTRVALRQEVALGAFSNWLMGDEVLSAEPHIDLELALSRLPVALLTNVGE